MINFRREGSGEKTLIFLHGWGGSWQSWAPIIERLKDKFTIYALDLPGFGLSSLPRVYSLVDYVMDIEHFFLVHKIKKPILVGHSFGGQVAAKFSVEKGDLLSGLVLADAAVVRRNDLGLRLNVKIACFGRNLFQMTPLARFYAPARKAYYRLRGMAGSDYFNAASTPNLQKTASRVFREDLMAKLKKIRIPTLIIWGENDPPELTPVETARKINEQIKSSKLVVISGVGHFSYLEDQERFCRELISFAKNL